MPRDPVPCDSITTLLAYEAGLYDAFIEAANMLVLSAPAIQLAAGEMSREEMRAVKAVLVWREREIRKKARELSKQPVVDATLHTEK